MNIKKGVPAPPPTYQAFAKKEQAASSKKAPAQRNPRLKELKLKAESYPVTGPRVQSAKSTQSTRNQQPKPATNRSSTQGPHPKVKMSIPLPNTTALLSA